MVAQKSKTDFLGGYAGIWGRTLDEILEGIPEEEVEEWLDPEFELDDPNGGKIGRTGMSNYVRSLATMALSARNGDGSGPLMQLSELVPQEEEILTAWCWWSIAGTTFQGAGLIKVGTNGVLSERLAYYAKLPS